MRATVLLRHLLSVAILPFTVAVLVPWWIAGRYGVVAAVGTSPGRIVLQALGLVAGAVGLLLFVASLRRFAAEGQGTLAPWDPPRRLVVAGPYRWVRNPMISGVFLVLAGEALLLGSTAHAIWTMLFLGANAVQVALVEEPALRRRFGDAYREYCRHVPRVIPRVRPWRGEREGRTG